MASITEEMRFRQRLCEYAIKHGVTKVARRYYMNRQLVYRQLKKYDGSVRSLAMRSRKPHGSSILGRSPCRVTKQPSVFPLQIKKKDFSPTM